MTARSKGLHEWVGGDPPALRNALIPILTIAGLQFGLLLAGRFSPKPSFLAWSGTLVV